jgi:3'-phosphoadenosine 5'-phosphosulfate sulfotransferase (PAPS reductase)/FAD synthetase
MQKNLQSLDDRVFIGYSGGKDSTALVAWALAHFPKTRIELWHQEVDGRSEPFMDWPCTPAYVRAVAAHLDLPVRFQWKVGGFEGEMTRRNRLTNPIRFERADGTEAEVGGKRGKAATREKFPQVSADLSVRWCSAYLKIHCAERALNNDPAYKTGRYLFLTGERREESSARARYAGTVLHSCHNEKRLVHQHRPILDWPEADVWDAHRELGVAPHVAYRLGYSRLSCQQCIFQDRDQAATNRKIAPVAFSKVAGYETRWGFTIKRNVSLSALADSGTPYPESDDAALVALALSTTYHEPVGRPASDWKLPAGAFKRGGGPS